MLSEELRRERESRGLSLERMAHETRISIHFLRAIESGDLAAVPGAFYQKAFVRAYARFVGLPEESVLASYDYYGVPGARGTGEAPRESASRPRPRPPRLPRRRRMAAAFSLAPLLLLGAVVTGAGTFWPRRNPGRIPSATGEPRPGETDEGQTNLPYSELELPFVPEECEGAGRQAISQETAAGLRLVVEVTEACWLEVRTDGVLVSSGTLSGGQSEQFRAHREVRLSLGNAGGVALRINGRPGKPLGRPGQAVKNLRITPDNFRDFLAS